MWHETWRVIWGGILPVLGAVALVAGAYITGCMVLGAMSVRRDARRKRRDRRICAAYEKEISQ